MAASTHRRPLFLLIDIDNCLYSDAKTHFGREMRDKIIEYPVKFLGIEPAESERLALEYYRRYGISLHGFKKHHDVDADHYVKFVHQCSYDTQLSYCADLVAMLQRLQFRHPTHRIARAEREGKTITEEEEEEVAGSGIHHLYFFTNGSREHAEHTLTPMGLQPLFTRTRPQAEAQDATTAADLEWLGYSYEDQWRLTMPDYANKPMRRAYEAVFEDIRARVAADIVHAAGSPSSAQVAAFEATALHQRAVLEDAGSMVMVDDSLVNLAQPLALGWSVVWVLHQPEDDEAKSAAARADPRSLIPTDGHAFLKAFDSGRMRIIFDIVELESAVEAFSTRRA